MVTQVQIENIRVVSDTPLLFTMNDQERKMIPVQHYITSAIILFRQFQAKTSPAL